MTEERWLNSTELPHMLESMAGLGTDRKMRLFAVSCCRRLWQLGVDSRSGYAVEIAEQFADGLRPEEMRQLAFQEAVAAIWMPDAAQIMDFRHGTGLRSEALIRAFASCTFNYAIGFTAAPTVPIASLLQRLVQAVSLSALDASSPAFTASELAEKEEVIGQARLLRDIIGNPFRPVSVDPSWLTSTVRALAEHFYDTRDFTAMPILADALQDAGCDNADILSHCRDEKQVHVRGCWIVDLVLGRK